jgi:2-polyprenyl-6-methoxyphenol hydroxylase-like FAD-dependent oxidoreductase
MMKEIEKHPSITIFKGILIGKIDFQSKKLFLMKLIVVLILFIGGTIEISETDRRQYQFVFAADGAFSKVRTQMVKSFMDL